MEKPRIPRKNREINIQLKIPLELHDKLKLAAKHDRRSMRQFIATAIEERVDKFFEDDIDNPNFKPAGLR